MGSSEMSIDVESVGQGARPSTGRLTLPDGRWVIVRGKFTRLMAHSSIARLLVLAAEDVREPIVVDIDSPGGSGLEALAMISTMKGLRPPLLTFCRGQAIGPAAVVVAQGLRGFRTAVAQARFSLASSISEVSPRKEYETVRQRLLNLVTESTGRSENDLAPFFNPGNEFGAKEAIKLGIIDAIASEPKHPT